ncbi:MAG TPA: serine kinase, partial [Bradyrhizobium sp.]
GVKLPRIPVAIGFPPLPIVIAALTTTESSSSINLSDRCVKGIGNHIHPTIATE